MSSSPLFPVRMRSLSRRGSDTSTNSTGSDTPRASPQDNSPSPHRPSLGTSSFSRRGSDASRNSDNPTDQPTGSPSRRPSLMRRISLSRRESNASTGSNTPRCSPRGRLSADVFDDFNQKVRSRQLQAEERDALLNKSWWRCCQCRHRLYFYKGVTEHNPLSRATCRTHNCRHNLCESCEVNGEAFTKIYDLQTLVDVDISGKAQKKYGYVCHRCGHSWYVQFTQQTIRKVTHSGLKSLGTSEKWEILWSRQPCINCEYFGHQARCSIKCLKFAFSDHMVDLTDFATSSKATSIFGVDSSDIPLNTPVSPLQGEQRSPEHVPSTPSTSSGLEHLGSLSKDPDCPGYQRQVDPPYGPPLSPSTQPPRPARPLLINHQTPHSVNHTVQKANWSYAAPFNSKLIRLADASPGYLRFHQPIERATQVMQGGNSRLDDGTGNVPKVWGSAQVQQIWQGSLKPRQ